MKNYLYFLGFLFFANFLLLSDKCQAQYSYNYANPIAHNSLTDFLTGILVSVQGLVGWLAVIFIVIGGVLYLTAGGKDDQINLAKKTILYALIGFAIALGGPSLLKEIQTLALGSGAPFDINNANSLGDILANVLDFILTLIGILALISLIFSGFSYLTSVGDKNKVDTAKKIALYSVIALAVSGGSIIMIRTILSFLNI